MNNIRNIETLECLREKVLVPDTPYYNAVTAGIQALKQVDERPKDEWIRKEDVIHLLKYWSDGYSYIEIPTDTAIKAIKEFKGGTEE